MLLEGRDRLGGRTWTAAFAGLEVEMGGAFVHWVQPHVWAELSRYGLEIEQLPDADRAFIRGDDGTRELDASSFLDLRSAFAGFCPDPEALVPQPMLLPEGSPAMDADRLSVAARLTDLEVPDSERDFLDSLCSTLSSTTNERASYLSIVRAIALAGFEARRLADVNGRWVIRGGTRALVDAIARDQSTEFRRGVPVTRIEQDGRGVSVATSDGPVDASAALVALPLNALGSIAFEPHLSETKRDAVRTRLTSEGIKVWAKVADGFSSAFAAAPDRFPLTFAETQGPTPDGGTAVVAFGPSARKLPPSDHTAVARAIEEMLPGASVEEVGGHDWVADPFAGETWATYAPGTWLRWMPELARPEGRVAFAGADLAIGGLGYIDGAVESGLRSAREVEAMLT